jgi:hypothetical protein
LLYELQQRRSSVHYFFEETFQGAGSAVPEKVKGLGFLSVPQALEGGEWTCQIGGPKSAAALTLEMEAEAFGAVVLLVRRCPGR